VAAWAVELAVAVVAAEFPAAAGSLVGQPVAVAASAAVVKPAAEKAESVALAAAVLAATEKRVVERLMVAEVAEVAEVPTGRVVAAMGMARVGLEMGSDEAVGAATA